MEKYHEIHRNFNRNWRGPVLNHCLCRNRDGCSGNDCACDCDRFARDRPGMLRIGSVLRASLLLA